MRFAERRYTAVASGQIGMANFSSLVNQEHRDVRSLRWQEAGFGLYLLAAVARLIYESVGSHGVYGWLAEQQMQRVGHFDFKLTLAGTAAVYLLPASPVLNHLKRLRARLAEEGTLAPGAPDACRGAVRMARVFMGPGLALLLAGGVGYYVLTQQNEANVRRRVGPLSAKTLAELPADAARLKFVEVSAVCQTQAAYRWTEKDSLNTNPEKHHRCLPLIVPDWRPGEPVRLFLQTTVDVYYPPDENSDQPSRPRDLDGEPFAGAFEGELERETLLLFVRHALQRAGIVVASPCYVLTHQTLHGQPRRLSRQDMLLAPGLGGGLGLIFLLDGALMYWRREGYAARIAARQGRAADPWR